MCIILNNYLIKIINNMSNGDVIFDILNKLECPHMEKNYFGCKSYGIEVFLLNTL